MGLLKKGGVGDVAEPEALQRGQLLLLSMRPGRGEQRPYGFSVAPPLEKFMRWSQCFIPTLREAPSDAEITSHKLMVRAGLIHRAGPGSYTWLPLGLKALTKAEGMVRNYMVRCGAAEIGAASVTINESEDGAWRTCIFDQADHSPYIDIARSHLSSYRQLPKVLFQIQTRPTGEPHPRAGMLFAAEAAMMDAYVFARDPVSLYESCHWIDHMLEDVCELAGLSWFWIDRADDDDSKIDAEYVALAGAGEKRVARSESGYIGTVEDTAVQPYPKEKVPVPGDMTLVDTPGARTVKDVCCLLQVEPSRLIKTLVYVTDKGPVAALVRGDHQLNERKLRTQLGASMLTIADGATVERVTGAPVGFAGPVGLQIPMIVDFAVDAMAWGVAGANKADTHFVNVVPDRHFPVMRTEDIHLATDGDLDPLQAMPLTFHRGVEVAHVFTFDLERAEAMGVTYLDESGKSKPMAMGYAGIGINRIVAAMIEASHDERGIIWTKALAPFDVEIVAIDARDADVKKAADYLHDALCARGVEVLYDDRDSSPGVKFYDADLIGLPLRVTVGKRSLKKGAVEAKKRNSDDLQTVELSQAADWIQHEIAQ